MTLKSRMRQAAKQQQLPSNSEEATLNRAGGVAFDIKDPATKLVTMTGGAFFAEPRYYEGTMAAKRVTAASGSALKDKFDKLEQRVEVNENYLVKCDLDEVSKEILLTAGSIAEGDNPEDLLIIAKWLRHDMNIRATPQALMVMASRFEATQPFVRKYAPHIAFRPDEPGVNVLMHRWFFGMKSLKNSLGQGLSDAMSKFKERGLLKYDSPGWPTYKDLLQILPRGQGRPLPQPLANYFLKGEVTHPEETPILAARKALAKCTKFDKEAQELALKSLVNWEVLLSQFGDQKNKVWSFLLDNNLVGYMAMLRNLRNMLQAGVNRGVVVKVAERLSDPEEVHKSRQLPFRFLMAHQMLVGDHYSMRPAGDHADTNLLLEAVENASNHACDNIPELPGVTAVFADNSGSMSTPVSEKSKMTCAGAANALCGIVAKRAQIPYVAAFATDVGPVSCTKNDTVVGIANKTAQADTNGWSTNGHRCIEWLMNNGIQADRVIILSDMQCWSDRSSDIWGNRSRTRARYNNVADAWRAYRKSSKKTSTCWLHSVHLNGYGDSVVEEQDRVNQVGGFSEKIFEMFLKVEGIAEDEGEARQIPTIEQIREMHRLD